MPIVARTVLLLTLANVFMTFAWYAHLRNLNHRAWYVAALASWGIALFEYLLQVPANRIGYTLLTLPQLKILQEVITLSVFVPFAIFYMRQPVTLNFLWASLCMVGGDILHLPRLIGMSVREPFRRKSPIEKRILMRHLLLLPVLLALTAVSASPVHAQVNPQPATHPVIVPSPPADPADVASIDAIVSALYDVISGGIGEPRNWARMRSLYIPGGRLMPLGIRAGGGVGIRLMEVNDYIALSGAQLERMGFRERELARRTEQFGHMAHVFSTYEGRAESDGMVVRGINSIQLMNDGSRWWIINVFWEAESANNQLPERYLTSS